MVKQEQHLPRVVSQAEWQAARDAFLVKEKAATQANDALAAERRRLPMVKIDKNYTFEGASGKATLLDLFDGRRQLLLYHFMLGPDDAEGCPGCSMFADNIGHLAHLHARDSTLVFVSRAPLAKILPFKKRMGWSFPWFSSFGTDFNTDFGVTVNNKEQPGMSVFLRDDDGNVYRTYFNSGRGLGEVGSVWSLLDITPFGRQENWEDSPEGWPQTPPYQWWRHHDKYVQAPVASSCQCH